MADEQKKKENVKPPYSQPSTPRPHPPITVQQRVAILRSYLDGTHANHVYLLPKHKTNIESLIQMYEEGAITVQDEVFVMEGKIVDGKVLVTGPKAPVWREHADRTGMQLAQLGKAAYGHGPYPYSHELRCQIRFPLAHGGDGSIKRVRMLNDTGSDLMTLFDTDLPELGDLSNYIGEIGDMETRDASGVVQFLPCYWLEVRMESENGDAWGKWFTEEAVLRPEALGVTRLSGKGIRNVFFMGTTPLHDVLSVANTKGGMESLLRTS